MSDVWIVDASPLIALAHAGALELLEKQPASLVVPKAVADEILAGPDDPAVAAIAAGWGMRRETTVGEDVSEWGLGPGESAVLALARSLRATAVLDDRNARRCARVLEVPTIGTFGVIIRAKNRGLIPAARPVIKSVVAAGLYYDDSAIKALLGHVGETWP